MIHIRTIMSQCYSVDLYKFITIFTPICNYLIINSSKMGIIQSLTDMV